jgi:hypothetical protein
MISAYRVKQYNSTTKTVITVDGVPVCIVAGKGITASNVIAYLQGCDVEIKDGAVKKVLDKVKEKSNG